MKRYPSDARVLGILPDLLDDLTATASQATVRQRQWAVNQAVEFYAHTSLGRADLATVARVRLAEILSPTAVDTYLTAAAQGTLRQRATETPTPESTRTTAARAATLRWLARHTDLPAPKAHYQDTALEDAGKHAADALYKAIDLWVDADYPALIRTAAVAAVICSTAATPTQLIRYQLTDLVQGPRHSTLPVTPHTPKPASFRIDADGKTTANILPWSHRPLQAWLSVRQHLVQRLQGTDPGALFVTCHANNQHQPPGLPISHRGLTASYGAALRYLERNGTQIHPPQTLDTVRRVALKNFLKPKN